MSDALTLTESRAVLMGLMRSPGMPSAEEAEDAIDALLAAHLRALAGTPESETMEQAMNAFREAATVEMQLGKRLDRQEEAGLHAAYPLLVAPLRAEVERLKGELQGVNAVADQIHANNVVLIDNSIYNEERLATAEQRVRELEDQLALTKRINPRNL